MDLLVKAILAAVVLAVIFIGIYLVLQHSLTQHVTEQQAVALVAGYLNNSYPNAIVNITNVTPSQYQGSWHMVASIVLKATSPCPSYYIYSYDYPQYGFVNRTENIYTDDCVINGFENNSNYIIASYPVAITRSYMLNVPIVEQYIKAYGFNNTVVHAHYYNSTSMYGVTYSKVWLVNYSAPMASYDVYVFLTQANGNLVAAVNQTH